MGLNLVNDRRPIFVEKVLEMLVVNARKIKYTLFFTGIIAHRCQGGMEMPRRDRHASSQRSSLIVYYAQVRLRLI